jgi:hypothetical protein
MPIKKVHRADGRDLNHASITKVKGFGSQNGDWAADSLKNARLFMKKMLGDKTDVSKQKGWPLAKQFFDKGVPGLMDIERTIKEKLKDKDVFWVSTSENDQCGGYATKDEYNVYEFTLPKELKLYTLDKDKFKLIDKREGRMKPCFCFDGKALDGSDSEIIGFNSGPLDDVEISFLTTLTDKWVKQLKKKK